MCEGSSGLCNYALITKRMLYLFFSFLYVCIICVHTYVCLYVWVSAWAWMCQEGRMKSEDNFGCHFPPSTLFKTGSAIIYPKYASLAMLWTSRGFLSTSDLSTRAPRLQMHTPSSGLQALYLQDHLQSLKGTHQSIFFFPRPHALLAMDSVKAQATLFPVTVAAKEHVWVRPCIVHTSVHSHAN